MPTMVRYHSQRALFLFWLEGAQVYVSVPWVVAIVFHYQKVVMNPTHSIISPREWGSDLVLGVIRPLDLNVAPSGFPFFQSIYALRNGMTGKQWVIEA